MNGSEFRRTIQDHRLTFKAAAGLIGVSEPTMRRLVSPSRTEPIPLHYVLALSAVLEKARRNSLKEGAGE